MTRLSAILHGLWVLLFVTILPGVISMVPLAALAGLLVYTGIKLVNLGHIRELSKRGEISVYLVTLLAIIGTNLLLGLGIGFALALFRLVWKVTHVDVLVEQKGGRYEVLVEGTLTFAGVPKLLTKLGKIPAGAEVSVDLAVRYLDHSGFEALHSWKSTHEKLGGAVELDHLEDIWARTNGRKRTVNELTPAEVVA